MQQVPREVQMRSCRCKYLGVAGAIVVAIAAGGSVRSLALSSAVPARPDDKTILHVLNRISFGPRPGDVDRVRQMGLETYIDQQLHPGAHRRHRHDGPTRRASTR